MFKKATAIAALVSGAVILTALPASASGIETWTEDNFRSNYANWGIGFVEYVGFWQNDEIDSIVVSHPATSATLYIDRNYMGPRITTTTWSARLGYWGFHDNISSIM